MYFVPLDVDGCIVIPVQFRPVRKDEAISHYTHRLQVIHQTTPTTTMTTTVTSTPTTTEYGELQTLTFYQTRPVQSYDDSVHNLHAHNTSNKDHPPSPLSLSGVHSRREDTVGHENPNPISIRAGTLATGTSDGWQTTSYADVLHTQMC